MLNPRYLGTGQGALHARLLHELRAPLNVILAWTHLLGGQTPAETDLRAGLEIIARNARRQATLLDRLSTCAPRVARGPISAGCDVLPNITGLHVLLVDDDDETRMAMRQIVARAGAAVEDVPSAVAAIARLERDRVDVLVSDIDMPGMDGYALLRTVRGTPSRRVRRTPAIALTSHASPTARRAALAAGFQAHLAKPVDAIDLCLVMASLARLGPRS